MILSHKYRYIFLKTAKTAGTSLEIALSRDCGWRDVITPNIETDERLRLQHGGRPPQNYRQPWWTLSLAQFVEAIRTRGRRRRFYNHIPAREVRPLVGEKIWNSYYKFCVERSPFDRVISQYYWRYQNEPRPALSDVVRSELPNVLREKGVGVYTIDGTVAVDRVYRYEELDAALIDLEETLHLPRPLVLPRAKAGHRKDRRSPGEILSESDRAVIAERFAWEIEHFGYDAG